MSKYFVWFTLLMVVCSLAVWAGVNPQKGKANKVDAIKVKEARGTQKDPSKCASPRPQTEAAKLPVNPVKFRSARMGSGFMKKSIGRKGNAIHIRATRAARSAPLGFPTLAPRNARNVSDSKLELSGVSD